GAQEAKIVGGTMQICEKIAETVGKEKILKEKIVTQIIWDENKTANGVSEEMDLANFQHNQQNLHKAEATAEEQKEEKILTVICSDGSLYRCRNVIVCFAPSLYKTIQFKPYMSISKRLLAEHSNPGSVIKIVTRYSQAF